MTITDQQIFDNADAIKAILGMDANEQEAKPVQEKVKCKVCGFHKKARRVHDGVCKVCAEAVKDSPESVEVVGRMGKRGRNSVSVVIDGKRYRVKRLSSRHSERVAAMYASKPKGYARKPKAHVTDIDSPKGLPTSSRMANDDRNAEQA